MKITPDDPKLTAYALGELNETDHAAIKAEIEKSPECQRAVEEIQRAAAMLAEEFSAEELPDLTFAQQRQIENQIRQPAEKGELFSWSRFLFYGATACAVLIMAAMLLPALSKSKEKTRHLTHLNTDRGEAVASSTPGPGASVAPTITTTPADQLNTDETVVVNNLPAGAPSESLTLGVQVAAGTRGQQNQPGKVDGFNMNVNGPAPQTLTPPLASGLPPTITLQGITTITRRPGDSLSPRTLRVSSPPNPEGKFPDNQLIAGRNLELLDRAGVRVENRYYSYDGVQPTTATYPQLVENTFLYVAQNPLSTFSIDVDTASYANVRRFLTAGQLPPHDAVRIEEMINYFSYQYPQPRSGQPFSVNVEVTGCPWNNEHRLARVGLKGREIAQDKRPPSNFVFLIDVSGSMQPTERLPLIKQALRQLVKKMGANDRVAIVVYANEAGIKLGSTSCTEKEKILEAIDALGAGGSTNGGDGIQQAYRLASENFIEGGVNRVLLCTDGDFNVGLTDQNQLVKLIQEKAKSGVFLTTLGVGTDNYKDALMQKLADKGNGNYHYLDTLEEAQKVLIDQMSGTLVTIAKDVKIQIEFNPAQVSAYRLIGYEKRMLRAQDFNNDKKDAGEIGAGHTVTALYEIVPAGKSVNTRSVDPLKYQAEPQPEYVSTTGGGELMTVKFRYKQPDGDTSKLIEVPVNDRHTSYARASEDFKFAAAVASFGMVLRDSEFKGSANFSGVLELAQEGKGRDESGYRSEFIQLVKKARNLSGNSDR